MTPPDATHYLERNGEKTYYKNIGRMLLEFDPRFNAWRISEKRLGEVNKLGL